MTRSNDLGLPILERSDINLVKDWDAVMDALIEHNTKQIFVGEGREIKYAILCRATRKKSLEEDAIQFHSGTSGRNKRTMYCYKMKV